MRFLWFLAALAYSTAATAQQLTVRSGDHPFFSRLTIPLPALQTWEAAQADNSIIIRLPGYSGGFDVENVFTRMGTDRIEALESDQNSITLRIICPCTSTAFVSGSLLVIDVADQGAKVSAAPIEKIPTKRPPRNRQIQVARGSLPWIGGNSPFNAKPHSAEGLSSVAIP
jgi:hypothetical protein